MTFGQNNNFNGSNSFNNLVNINNSQILNFYNSGSTSKISINNTSGTLQFLNNSNSQIATLSQSGDLSITGILNINSIIQTNNSVEIRTNASTGAIYLEAGSGGVQFINVGNTINYGGVYSTGAYFNVDVNASKINSQGSNDLVLNCSNTSRYILMTISGSVIAYLSGTYGSGIVTTYGCNLSGGVTVDSFSSQVNAPNGMWMPSNGSTSLWITDAYNTLNTPATTLGRYFGVGGIIYQDYFGAFYWRGTTTLNEATIVTRMYLSGSGVLNIGTLGTGVVYSIGGSLTSTNPSDETMKKNIKPIKNSLSMLTKLKPVTYYWKEQVKHGNNLQFGLIAQQVQKIFPDLVDEFQEDIRDYTIKEMGSEYKVIGYQTKLGIDYIKLIPIMIDSIQEQQNQIQDQQNQITLLTKSLSELILQVNNLTMLLQKK
jgi:hypothetical protein